MCKRLGPVRITPSNELLLLSHKTVSTGVIIFKGNDSRSGLQTLVRPSAYQPNCLTATLTPAHSGIQLSYVHPKLQALVYDILLSTTAVFSYAIGSRKLSANGQFFVGAQTEVSLLQTTQIISDVCFITDHVAYASSNKTKIV